MVQIRVLPQGLTCSRRNQWFRHFRCPWILFRIEQWYHLFQGLCWLPARYEPFCSVVPIPSTDPSIDIDQLVGNKTNIQIPQVVVKWITYALVLHIVALVLAAISSFFGLLAHVREFSMTCFSTCISGLGAAITLLAFIFDLVFFFLAKSRINSVKGGSATMGSAIWLTFTAWLLLLFSGCFYSLGRCCIRRRPRDMARGDGGTWVPAQPTGPTYEEQMRLDAVKAEADRKGRQGKTEMGLPAFPE